MDSKKIIRDFSKRTESEREWFTQNTWCDTCKKADLGLENPEEYELNGTVYISGLCRACGKEVKSKISRGSIEDDTIIIRKAKPELKEGLVFAKFFNEASEGFFKSMLGTKTYDIIADAFVKSNNEYSFENATMLEYKGEIVGMVSGYTFTEKKEFTKKILHQFAGGAKLKIRIFTLIGNLLSRLLGPQDEGDYYLQAIAVSGKIRGKGLGQRLMKHSTEIAIKKGCKTLSLDVSSKNSNAIKSYYKFNMKAFSSWPNFLKLPPVFTRMVKEL